MTFPAARFRLFAIRARDFARQDSGIAAVEFALILPIMVVLWFGGVELTQALSVDRRLNNLASSIGDLVARSKMVTSADIDAIFDIAPGAMYPFCKTEAACNTAGLGMRMTQVKMSAAGVATVGWSQGQGKTAYTAGQNMNSVVPATLRVPNTYLIVSEVSFTYTPAVGYVVTGNVALDDKMFFVPRLSTSVQLCTTVTPTPTGCVS